MLTSLTYFGFLPGYALFWGLFVIALGLFSFRVFQLLQYMFLGQKETGYKRLGKWITSTFAYVFSQLCQLKNFRAKKDSAPLGHALMAWGFFVFVLFKGLNMPARPRDSRAEASLWVMHYLLLAPAHPIGASLRPAR